ncbi:hypothetical protein [Paludibaculum fermentans]|uniref:hypothetical protein n=1 Tax=Paludibaculum fermentans TaxID=1473598 RepID=UPI003EB912F1
MANLLYVEDQEYEYENIIRSLRTRHSVTLAASGAAALAKLRQKAADYNIVILDLMLPHGQADSSEDAIPLEIPSEKVGEYVFGKMGTLCPSMPVIILTALRSNLTGLRDGPSVGLMMKPVKTSDLLVTIEMMLGSGA